MERAMSQNLEKLKTLLAELFQLDQAELDFGIYRIMNTKREEITRFLERDLLPQVREVLSAYERESRSALEVELEKAKEQAKALGFEDPAQAPKVKELQARYNTAFDVEAAESEVYSHLYNFFRRYYSEGDFISLRRYKEGVYAIPYEGEEVKLYWANHDQYYIKTSEYLRNYTFKLPSGKRVHFKLVEADTEKDNNRPQNGKERRFIYKELTAEGAEERGENIQFVFRFEYRTDEEKRKQDVLNDEAARRMLADLEKLASPFHSPPLRSSAFSAVKHLSANWKRADGTAAEKTVLEKHLTDYTARNTFDYFIHKDLGGFLRRELDFYIKNEVMHLDDIESETAPRVEQYLAKIKAIRRIAHKLIDFLAQIENFQKKLWLKKKFVVETQYCVTLDRVPEELYPEIAANDAQREEWVRLFAIDEITAEDAENRRGKKGRNQEDLFPASSAPSVVKYSIPLSVEFLKANPYLVLDTRHFSETFKRRLLASFEDLDEQCDGLLIHSENFQALNLLMERYRGKVKCIYIDPPYNTGNDGFAYKDTYQHSSWLSMLSNRYRLSYALLPSDGIIFTSIDDGEHHRLVSLQMEILGAQNFVGNIIWQKKYSPANDAKWFSDNHDFITAFARDKVDWQPTLLPRTEAQDARYINPDNDPRGPWKPSGLDVKTYSPDYDYPITTPSGRVVKPPPGSCWRFSRARFEEMVADNRIWFGPQGDNVPAIKRFLSEVKQGITPLTVWTYKEVGHNQEGAQELKAMLGGVFASPKVVRLMKRVIHVGTAGTGCVLDFFAGSGTTAHAVINLNREDGGRRKYILVEMGEYFDTVLVPRIKKVVYSKDWKDGKPLRSSAPSASSASSAVNPFSGISHMFKYMRLESYEDTLNNLELRRTVQQKNLLFPSEPSASSAVKSFREDYMLHYMLDVESRGSASLLNLDRFEDPFNYTLNIATGTVGEPKPTVVDLVETFNYLIGLRVKTIDHIGGVRVVTGANPQGERLLILWRNIKEMGNDALDAWFRKQGYNTKDQEFDVIYVNGDNNLENLKKPDQTWKVRLIEEEFLRRMFDVADV